jgi:DNA-binding LacI/PurR family transcriptional regulator
MVNLELQRAEPIQHQLTWLIRNKILSGEMPEGMRLPAGLAWAKQLGTNYFTLHSALLPLVKEGLIERRPRAGTFVRSRHPVSSMVIGVYCCRSFWNMQHHGFTRAVLDALRSKLAAKGHLARLWIDERPEDAQFEPLPELVQAIRNKEIQGLAVVLANFNDIGWLKELPVPKSFLSGANLPNKIEFDHIQLIEFALDRLVAQGCRTVGLISGVCPGQSERGWQHPGNRFYDDYLALCAERGLDRRNAWIRSPLEELRNPELFGYIEFQKLWAQPEHPEGLIVFPDVVATGVLKALMDVDPVSRPRLAIHRNRGMNLDFPPIAASWIYFDLDAVADGLIHQIFRQVDGEAVPHVMLPYTISDQEELP